MTSKFIVKLNNTKQVTIKRQIVACISNAKELFNDLTKEQLILQAMAVARHSIYFFVPPLWDVFWLYYLLSVTVLIPLQNNIDWKS